jgi:ABC-type transport system involved in multi-copper enzyme maturation permease subunit
MTWLTWRQLRVQTAAVLALIAAFATSLALTGPHLRDLARGKLNLYDALSRTDHQLFYAGIVVVAVAPAVIGAFWGAPLVARELEAGTHRLVWNQSITRTRWLATRLGVAALIAMAATGALTLAVSWWSEPLDGTASTSRGSLPGRLTPISFAMRGIVPVAYVLFALALGAALGAVLRRSVPAIAVTLLVVTVVQIAVPRWVRPHLMTPVTATVVISQKSLDSISLDESGGSAKITVSTGHAGSWLLSNRTVNAAGAATSLPPWMGSCLPGPPPPGEADGKVRAAGDLSACFDRLTAEGYRQQVSYLPAERFWALQWRESTLYVLLAGLLTALCFGWTRRRLA